MEKYKPTMQLRWNAVNGIGTNKPVAIRDAEQGATHNPVHYKLQQYWQHEKDDDKGQWRDIEYEHSLSDD
jgi:hypothetical protein